MNNTLKTKYLKRVDYFLGQVYDLWMTRNKKTETVQTQGFNELEVGTNNLIVSTVGKNSPYYKNLQEAYQTYRDQRQTPAKTLIAVIGILIAFRDDLKLGLIDEIEDIALVGLFTDSLEMAQNLLETGYKDSAATLAGSVLESGLKKLANKNNIQLESNKGIGVLNRDLGNARIYTYLEQQQIKVWATIRNNAAHGKFDEYTTDNVKYMLEGIQNFLAKHLG